jgi:hypothetical protein
MFDRLGEWTGDKVGAVTGQLRTQRMWVKGFGRRRRRVAKIRAQYARRGRVGGAITGWVWKVGGIVLGKFF